MAWDHGICERCWFVREPDRFPVQVIRESGDHLVDNCCFCGLPKITRIYVRQDPTSSELVCNNEHEHDDEDDGAEA